MPDTSIQTVTAVVIDATTDQTLAEPVHRCQERADGQLGDLPIRSINGVLPSAAGDITITVKSAAPIAGDPPVTLQMTANGLKFVDKLPMCQGGT